MPSHACSIQQLRLDSTKTLNCQKTKLTHKSKKPFNILVFTNMKLPKLDSQQLSILLKMEKALMMNKFNQISVYPKNLLFYKDKTKIPKLAIPWNRKSTVKLKLLTKSITLNQMKFNTLQLPNKLHWKIISDQMILLENSQNSLMIKIWTIKSIQTSLIKLWTYKLKEME